MATPIVPGLQDQSQIQSTPSGSTPDQRPQAPPDAVQVPQLHPVAQPLDNYARPPQAVSNDANLQRLSQALSPFQPELQNFTQAETQLQQVQGSNALAPLAGKSPADFATALQTNPALQSVRRQMI